MVILVIFDFGNAVICSLYIKIIIFIIVADLTLSVFDFDHFDLDILTNNSKHELPCN